MGQLIAEERRRIFIARQRTNAAMLTRPAVTVATADSFSSRLRVDRLVKTAAIVALVAAGWFAGHVELHIPASIAEMLPRV